MMRYSYGVKIRETIDVQPLEKKINYHQSDNIHILSEDIIGTNLDSTSIENLQQANKYHVAKRKVYEPRMIQPHLLTE